MTAHHHYYHHRHHHHRVIITGIINIKLIILAVQRS